MSTSLCTPDDVADMWRPFTDDEERAKVQRLIDKASGLLRQKLPAVDVRMQTYQTLPTDESALDPQTVATVVATVVKRFLSNPDGVAHMSKALGGANVSYGYALRGDKDVRGELIVTDSDLSKLDPPMAANPWIGTVRTKHNLAPSCDPLMEEFTAADTVSQGEDYPDNSWLDVAP